MMFSQKKNCWEEISVNWAHKKRLLGILIFKPFRNAQSITKNPKFGKTPNFILLSAEKQVVPRKSTAEAVHLNCNAKEVRSQNLEPSHETPSFSLSMWGLKSKLWLILIILGNSVKLKLISGSKMKFLTVNRRNFKIFLNTKVPDTRTR